MNEQIPCQCVNCGTVIYFPPSMAMRCGDNIGIGTCGECREFLLLELNDSKTAMVSERFRDKYPEETVRQ